jgi:hypothetical protein
VTVYWNVSPDGVVRTADILDVEQQCVSHGLSVSLRNKTGTLIARSGRLSPSGGPPLTIAPTRLFIDGVEAPCDSTSCTVHFAPTNAAGTYAGGYGVDPAQIERVDVALVNLP